MELRMSAAGTLLLMAMFTPSHSMQRPIMSPAAAKSQFDDEFSRRLKITADNVPIHEGNVLRSFMNNMALAAVKEQFMNQMAQSGMNQEDIEDQLEMMMPALAAQVAAGQYMDNSHTLCSDTFERADACPTHDGERITWSGCTESSNPWDIATATAHQREDGSWDLRDFVIQFCSVPEGTDGCPHGKQAEYHIRPENGSWVSTEHNDLCVAGERSQGILPLAGATKCRFDQEGAKLTILDADRQTMESIFPAELAGLVGSFAPQDSLMLGSKMDRQTPKEQALGLLYSMMTPWHVDQDSMFDAPEFRLASAKHQEDFTNFIMAQPDLRQQLEELEQTEGQDAELQFLTSANGGAATHAADGQFGDEGLLEVTANFAATK